MIMLEVQSDEHGDYQHFTVRADEPMRVEVMVIDGKAIAHVYTGTEDDLDQEPLGAYDGNNVENRTWDTLVWGKDDR